jgi:diacylglycerol kinase (ATP)
LKIINATKFAIAGLQTAIRKHYAIKLELIAWVLLTILLYLSSIPVTHKAILLICLTSVLIIELINSAIETTIDRFSLERHPLSKEAKDLASAAVFLAILLNVVIWPLLFFNT